MIQWLAAVQKHLSLSVVSVSACSILFKLLMRNRMPGLEFVAIFRKNMPSRYREQEQNWIHLSTVDILFSVWKKAKSRHLTRIVFLSLEIHETSDWAHPGVCATPITEAPVLARPQVVVTAPVMGLLVHQPVAIYHAAGVEIWHTETVHKIGTVVCQLRHCASHVEMFIQPQLEGTIVLKAE